MFQVISIVILCVICAGVGAGLAGYHIGHRYCTELVLTRKLSDKHFQLMRVYDMWMSLGQDAVADHLKERGVESVAIYGFSYLGNRLYHELKDSGIEIKYAMDQNPQMQVDGLDIKIPDVQKKNTMPDAVVVTALYEFDAIREKLAGYGYTKIYSLYGMLYEIAQNSGGQ